MKNDHHHHHHHQEFDHHQDHFFQMGSYGTATPESERPTSFSEPTTSCQSPSSSADPLSPIFKTDKGDDSKVVVQKKKKKLERKANSYVYRIREHVKLGPKFSETVKGKLSLGAKIIRKGGRENIFRQIFSVSDGEELLKASQCYLSTTAGPIAGILFISTEKVAFCSERPVTLSASPGGVVRTPYKVSIPVRKIKKANESANVDKPAKKYIEIVTDDNFEFWFMGFVRYEKALKNLRKAISMSSSMPF
ncbi:putative GEM-like protein 8 isoform X1 [Coffea arabica]|uniref:GEM-like protein 7 isoform X2 n=1 Tax=Coffea arabica TaxID=13443 RepID=A0A6P6X6T2_COFAR|nr:GEM-like protein 7 isoform X2 [Coffea arabica]